MERIKNIVKYNAIIYKIYRLMGTFFIKFLTFFVKVDDKKILFVSFGGKKYDDSPKEIYEKMIRMNEFKDYKFVWAFIDSSNKYPKGNPEIIKIDSLRYFLVAASCKYWIVNVSAQRGLEFKKKNNICINTWHGTPLKRIYGEENNNVVKIDNRKKEKFDLVCSQSEYDREIFSRIFNIDKENVILSDLPRNDTLLNYSKEDINVIKEKLNIDKNKKVLLYMPTYREYSRNEKNECVLKTPINLEKWQDKLGDNFVVLMRLHYLVAKELNVTSNDFMIDVSNYSTLSDLYAIADGLISDYSSSFFDYSILERKEFCFAYDVDEYEKQRGFYLDIYKELPCKINKTEDELIEDILNSDFVKKDDKVIKFKNKYAPYAGNATDKVIEIILKRYING